MFKGEFPIHLIFSCQPLQAVNQQFFSNDACSAEEIVDLLRPFYEERIPNEAERTNHEMFMQETLPMALRRLAEKDKSFILDFVFFISGSRCIPHTNGYPDFVLNIYFDSTVRNDQLPSSHACDNLLHVAWDVYNNDPELLMEKLERATEYGKKFDMN